MLAQQRLTSAPGLLAIVCRLTNKDAASVRALELLGKELGMFVERHADVSAHYAISDEPQSLEDWALEFTGKPLPK